MAAALSRISNPKKLWRRATTDKLSANKIVDLPDGTSRNIRFHFHQ